MNIKMNSSWYGVFTTLASSLLLVVMSGCSNAGSPERGVVTVLADDRNYQARLEPETLWYGVLREAQRGGAPPPNQRGGLYYQLATGAETHLVYTKDVIPQLESLLGHNVVVKGKLLTPPDAEVPSEELWPATVQLDEAVDPLYHPFPEH